MFPVEGTFISFKDVKVLFPAFKINKIMLLISKFWKRFKFCKMLHLGSKKYKIFLCLHWFKNWQYRFRLLKLVKLCFRILKLVKRWHLFHRTVSDFKTRRKLTRNLDYNLSHKKCWSIALKINKNYASSF